MQDLQQAHTSGSVWSGIPFAGSPLAAYLFPFKPPNSPFNAGFLRSMYNDCLPDYRTDILPNACSNPTPRFTCECEQSKSFLCHTSAKLCETPKHRVRNSFGCHTCEPPPG